MAANAPYYQMPSGQIVTTPGSTNAAPCHTIPEGDGYEPSASDVASLHEYSTASYREHSVRQTPTDMPVNTFEENHNLAGLLQAATTGAGQATQTMNTRDAGAANGLARGEGKRKRSPSLQTGDAAETSRADTAITSKHRRVEVPTDPQLQTIEPDSGDSPKGKSVPPPGESLRSDARTAGVHSAAALFRRSSEKTATRKHTRPPMSKLFMSLQLTPENFLQLQAQAKTYMLDTTFPERQSCVGKRGKGDPDMIKLRLFNCVRDFLSDGVGDEFFGENVEKQEEQEAIEAARALGEDDVPRHEARLTWPRDGNKIIGLVTPLMRRMVTNERQRMYAIKTRKGGNKKDKEGSIEAITQPVIQSPSDHIARDRSVEQQPQHTSDPNLRQASQTPQSMSPSVLDTTGPERATTVSIAHHPIEEHQESADTVILPLPSTPAAPHVREINLFLVLGSNSTSSSASSPYIKLDQTRIVSTPSSHLTTYPWRHFSAAITTLLTQALTKYPTLRNHVVPHPHHSNYPSSTVNHSQSQSPSPSHPSPHHPPTHNLRDLAAAANAIHATNTPASSTRHRSADESLRLPRYVVKTVGPQGWEYISDAREWDAVLWRRSRDVWADGVVNFLVEVGLVDDDDDGGGGGGYLERGSGG